MKKPINKVIPENETPYQKQQRETVETIADTLDKLSSSVEALLRGPLNQQALVLLLAASSRQKKEVVAAVLRAMQDLRKDWTNS